MWWQEIAQAKVRVPLPHGPPDPAIFVVSERVIQRKAFSELSAHLFFSKPDFCSFFKSLED